MMKNKFIKILSIGLLLFGSTPYSFAETLRDALVETYYNNPTLQIARHALAQAKQNVRLAESGFFPNIAVAGSVNYQDVHNMQSTMHTKALQLVIDQNLFAGFKTLNGARAAKAREQAQAQNLRNEEQNQLNNAVAAYVNVYASREIVGLRRSNLLALKEQVRTAKARLEVGEGTKTDYAQAQAAYSRAESEYSQAIAENTQAEAVYKQITGSDPQILSRPTICYSSPKTLNEALAVAFEQHPAILAANYNLAAAQANLAATKGDFAPKIDLSVRRGYQKTVLDTPIVPVPNLMNNGTTTSVGLKLTMPLYEGGARFSQLAIVRQQVSQAQLQLSVYQNNVRSALVAAWATLKSARVSVRAYLESVKAAKVALAGREAEHKVGQATELDVLTTRSQLITMQVALVNAKKALVVASYNLKSALGHLTAMDLDLIADTQNL